MKKIVTTIFALLVAFSLVAQAQWQEKKVYSPFRSVMKPDNLWGINGFTIDKAGRLWITPYDATDTSLGSGANVKRREIFIINPDGTPAPFSPIKTLTFGGVIDSLNNNNPPNGLSTDPNGNILFSSWDRLYRINYQTGAAMNFIVTQNNAASVGSVGVDSAGNIFLARVVGNKTPIKIFDKNFVQLGSNAVDSNIYITRKLLVNSSGTRLYEPNIYGVKQVTVFGNDLGPGFGTYTNVDTILKGMQVESMAWQPRPGGAPLLWASAGSLQNPPDLMWKESRWYGYNLQTRKAVDSISWGITFPGNPTWDDTVADPQRRRPRGIAFTPTGDTAYVAMFLRDSNSVKMFVKAATSVSPISNVVPASYALTQNYPNPFNPSTKIEFSITKAGLTTVKVYDLLGKEVVTLVDENLAPGSYKTDFDASRLSSGTYIYTLTSGGTRISKKMLLVK